MILSLLIHLDNMRNHNEDLYEVLNVPDIEHICIFSMNDLCRVNPHVNSMMAISKDVSKHLRNTLHSPDTRHPLCRNRDDSKFQNKNYKILRAWTSWKRERVRYFRLHPHIWVSMR